MVITFFTDAMIQQLFLIFYQKQELLCLIIYFNQDFALKY